MTRRMSEKEKRERTEARAAKKAEEADAPAGPDTETGGGASPDETTADAPAPEAASGPPTDESGGEEPEDIEVENDSGTPAAVPVPKKGFLAPPEPHASPVPNKPSFDWVEVDGEKVPNLGPGEEVVGEFEKDGLRYVRTTGTRFIYLATAAEYEKVNGLLPVRQVYIESFPHAFPKKVRPKG